MIETTDQHPDYSVVVPVHNEAENIAPLIREIGDVLNTHVNYELIYVDDGSTDETLHELLAVASEFEKLRVLHHDTCYGQSAAIKSGVDAARAGWIITLDGDGQNDPSSILNLIAAHRQAEASGNVPMICGQRTIRQDSLIKRISSRIANGIRGRLLGDRTPDTGCGLKLFARTTFRNIPCFDHMHRFLPALVLRNGGQVISVSVKHRPRLKGKTHYGVMNRLWIGIVDLLGVMWLQRRKCHPLATEIKK